MSQEATPTPLVDSSAFYDEAVYQRELNVIFRRTWLFVGHESMIPNPGDFITTYMADDAVIVCRDKESNVRVLLNKCRHRATRSANLTRATPISSAVATTAGATTPTASCATFH
ncbi:Rieske 2Fe-2S domain-containing protein [Mycobacterium intracellulare]|uniref:Rieske 2Fe-2S domain-containing protein n=1 Tax=Mycobacterium intracellulare TaxID=1767 RepID=UPI002E7A2974|nr:Rieske 2Fe-2S domain-containing protein [Mycobacterium intracellulare]